MKILYVASEALPYASTGGLADVVGSLPIAVKRILGEDGDVRVVLPLYGVVKQKFASEMKLVKETEVTLSWRRQYCGIYEAERSGVKFCFIDNEYYFKRTSLYGSFDDGERFAFFGKAVLELMSVLDFWPDILHANDWQSAPAVIYLKRKLGLAPSSADVKVLYTIHNIAYQGIYDFSILGDVFEMAQWDRPVVEYDGCINLTKGAIVCSDRISTVSPRYAKEIMTDYYSSGLTKILQMYEYKLSGIINGIDVEYYNPESDPEIPANYKAGDLRGKAVCKKELQLRAGIPENRDVPIIAMVSRLASHKGFDLVQRVLEDILIHDDVQIVLLGTGEHELEDFFTSMARKYPEKMSAMIEYNKTLSKLIYAGSDLFLMPSRSEPCGLSQMIASRYGTVPIVRETGGLADTIHPYVSFTGEGNGFTFANYNAGDMLHVIREALAVYRERDRWNSLVKTVMSVDFSWNASAHEYLNLYRFMLSGTR